ncbi:MAG: zinc-binding dehydrogenase [Firmicutes bacterium]|nr:zinc-binding dehydrogenase [Bacillota bacterium]
MYGVVLPGHKRVEGREFPTPEPASGQALIRMKASGLCGSDLRAIYHEHLGEGAERYQNVIAGHEPAGEVAAVGSGVFDFAPGDRVIVYHIAGCGTCRECRRGQMISCTSPRRQAYGWQRDGGHADYLLAEASTLVHLPDELSYVDGALIACGFGTVYQAIVRAAVSGRDTVLIVGLGPVGLAAVMLAIASGADVVAVDLVPARLRLAERLGARCTLLATDETLSQVQECTRGRGTEVAFDCSGSQQGRKLCLEAARARGRVVYLGEGGTLTFAPSPLLLHKNLSIIGSWVCGLAEMEELSEHLARKGLHPELTVTDRFELRQAARAYETFAAGECGKVVIEM